MTTKSTSVAKESALPIVTDLRCALQSFPSPRQMALESPDPSTQIGTSPLRRRAATRRNEHREDIQGDTWGQTQLCQSDIHEWSSTAPMTLSALANCQAQCNAGNSEHHGGNFDLRVRLGTLDFDCSTGGMGFFETSGLRVLLQLGVQAPVRWVEGAPTTQKQQSLKFNRVVSERGQYSLRVSCEFDEEIDLPWPGEGAHEYIVADLWMEKRTVTEWIDTVMGKLGCGTNLPEYDRTWLGRAVCRLPPQGEDMASQTYDVVPNLRVNGPMPKMLTVGLEWVGGASGDEYDEASHNRGVSPTASTISTSLSRLGSLNTMHHDPAGSLVASGPDKCTYGENVAADFDTQAQKVRAFSEVAVVIDPAEAIRASAGGKPRPMPELGRWAQFGLCW